MSKTSSLLFIVVVLTIVGFSSSTTDYCKVQCPLGTPSSHHTKCLYTGEPSKKCETVIKTVVTQEEKDELLKEHNDFRQKVAAGKETRGNPGPQPKAKSMPMMEWDDELANVAQTWANQCTFAHDKCRNVARFGVGQNIAAKSTTGIPSFPVKDLIVLWENEVAKYNNTHVGKLSGADVTTAGHYTQMVWAKSTKLGCGMITYKQNKWTTVYLVCNYGPAGNYFGEPLYEVEN